MSSGDQEALRLADLFECIPIASGSLDNIESAGRELRRLVAEREADRAVMREALEALETCDCAHISDGGRQWYDDEAVDAAIEKLKARTQ